MGYQTEARPGGAPFCSYAFDQLSLDAHDLRDRPLAERKDSCGSSFRARRAWFYVEHVASGTDLFA
jgi:ATP-dependent DNA ligase